MKMPVHRIKKVVIVRPDAIGDMVLTLPCIQAIKQHYPDWHITVLASRYNSGIIQHINYIDDIILDWRTENKIHSLRDRWAYIQFLKSHHFDLAIHFYSETDTVWSAVFAGIPFHIGDKAKLGMWPIFRKYGTFLKTFDQTNHVVEYNFQLLASIGIALDPTMPLSLPVPKSHQKTAETILLTAGRRPQVPLIGIQLGVGFGNKAIEPEKLADYINLLRTKQDVDVCISPYTDKEKALAERFLSRVTDPVLVFPPGPIMDFLGLLSHYSVYVSVDTGPFHMATAIGVPILAIFPTRKVKPTRWAPWRTRHLIVRESQSCPHFCPHEGCQITVCSDAIITQDMVEKTQRLLSGEGNQAPDDQFRDWFKRSMSVLILDNEIERENATLFEQTLRLFGIRVTRADVTHNNLANVLLQNDVTVIHNFTKTRKWRLEILARNASLQLFNPPLIIHEDWAVATEDALIHAYRQKFKEKRF